MPRTFKYLNILTALVKMERLELKLNVGKWVWYTHKPSTAHAQGPFLIVCKDADSEVTLQNRNGVEVPLSKLPGHVEFWGLT